MSLVTVNYLQHPLVSPLLPFIYFTLTSRATVSNYWAPLKDYCMMYRLPVSGSTGQWWDGNAGSCRCRQIPVSHPPVGQTGALSLLTRRLSCLTRAIGPSCCFFTLVSNCIFFFCSPFPLHAVYNLSDAALRPLRWPMWLRPRIRIKIKITVTLSLC